jgi:hypothetical protein
VIDLPGHSTQQQSRGLSTPALLLSISGVVLTKEWFAGFHCSNGCQLRDNFFPPFKESLAIRLACPEVEMLLFSDKED